MSVLGRTWSSVKSWFHKEDETIMVELQPWEHSLLQKFHPLFNQIWTVLKQGGVALAEQELGAVMAAAASGGNIGVAIAATVPGVLDQIETDAKDAARNAVYGVAAAVAASLPAQQPAA